jgi:hypothetical protein
VLFYEKNKHVMQQNFEHQHVVSESIDSTNDDLYDYNNNDDTGGMLGCLFFFSACGYDSG